jgi:hypothetical protein
MGIRIRQPLLQAPLTQHTEPTSAPRIGDRVADAKAGATTVQGNGGSICHRELEKRFQKLHSPRE